MAILLIAIINAANVLSVVLLVRFIINGGKASGHELVVTYASPRRSSCSFGKMARW